MRETQAMLEEMKARWMTGGSAAAAAPPAWTEAAGEEPDLALLALAGQFLRVAERPVDPAGTAPKPDLPKLALPPLPDALRPLFRRTIEDKELGSPRKTALLALMAGRGVTCHPFDLIPKADDDLPTVYGPWLDWQGDAGPGAADDDVLTAENWDDWRPHARSREFARMLADDRPAARALIAAIAPQVAADQRLRMFSDLQRGLQADDAELLESFASDRSGKVADLCTRMLMRLGSRKAPDDRIAEVLDTVSVGPTGVLRKVQQLVLKKLKTTAQKQRFRDTLALVPAADLAHALGLDPAEMVQLWPEDDLECLSGPVVETATDAVVAAWVERLIAAKATALLQPLYERLSADDRVALAPRIAAIDGPTFAETAACLGSAPGCLPYDALAPSSALEELEKAIRAEENLRDPVLHTAFLNLGLIADADAAEKLMTVLTTKLGLLAADPRLALLRLNASLKETAP